jgi:hypothetical protein
MWAEEELSYSDGPDVLMLRYALIRHYPVDRVLIDHWVSLHDWTSSEAQFIRLLHLHLQVEAVPRWWRRLIMPMNHTLCTAATQREETTSDRSDQCNPSSHTSKNSRSSKPISSASPRMMPLT